MNTKKMKVVGFAILAVSTASFAALNAFARPAYGYEKTYYYDAARTEIAGTRELFCSGGGVSTGVVTNYFDTITFKC